MLLKSPWFLLLPSRKCPRREQRDLRVPTLHALPARGSILSAPTVAVLPLRLYSSSTHGGVLGCLQSAWLVINPGCHLSSSPSEWQPGGLGIQGRHDPGQGGQGDYTAGPQQGSHHQTHPVPPSHFFSFKGFRFIYELKCWLAGVDCGMKTFWNCFLENSVKHDHTFLL